MSETAFITIPETIEIHLRPENVKDKSRFIKHQANEDLLSAFAKAADIPSAQSISFEVKLSPFKDGIHVKVEGKAILERLCVISLIAFEEVIDINYQFDLLLERAYNSYYDRLDNDAHFAQSQLMADEPEQLSPEGVNLFALLYELIALNLSPYPRAQDSDEIDMSENNIINATQNGDAGDKSTQTHTPFANLAELLQKRNEEG